MKILLFLILYIPQLLFAATFYQTPYGFTNKPISEYTANGHTLESYSQWYASLYCSDSSYTCTVVYITVQTTSPYFATMRFCKTSTQYETLLGYDGTNCIVSNTDFCPTGTHAEFTPPLPASGPSTRSCVPDQPECPEPPLHPCDTRDPLKAGFCKTIVTWDSNQCQWKSNNCGWEEMSNFGGYYYSDFLDPVKNGNTVCMFGCAFNHDETWAGTPPVYHISANGQYCIPDTPEPDPTEPPPLDNIETDDGDTWEPDDNPNTYCGEFNGEYVCVDSIPDNTCVSTPGGNIVCVGSPEPKPETVKQPPPDPDLGGVIGDGNYYFYDNDTINYGGGGLRICPEGYTLEDGICVKAPVDGECPPGSTLQGGMCVYTDPGQWGQFNPPSGQNPPFPDIPPYDYSTSLSNAFNALSSANILNIQLNCSSSNFQCPSLSIMGVSTDIHCDLITMAMPYFQIALWGIAGFLAIRIFLTA